MLTQTTILTTEVIVLIIGAIAWAKYDSTRTIRSHTSRAIARGLFITLQAWVLTYAINWQFVGYWLFMAGIWWLIFDMAYNWFHPEKVLFDIGNTAFLDRIFYPHWDLQLICKIVVIIVGWEVWR